MDVITAIVGVFFGIMLAILGFVILVHASVSDALKYLKIDLIAIVEARTNAERTELIGEKIRQRTGLALWRIYNNLKILARGTSGEIEIIGKLASEMLDPQNDLSLGGNFRLNLGSPVIPREKEAAIIITEASDEIKKLKTIDKMFRTGVFI